jgi:hypothetical protein
MELPVEVVIHNTQLGMKGGHGRLLRICPEGHYEVIIALGENLHRALLPVSGTVLIVKDPEDRGTEIVEVER